MTLIKSISGIRGTIGGRAGDTLNPLDIVKFVSAYATFIARKHPGKKLKIVVGRDARISGPMVKNVVCGTLMGIGADVVNIGLATTPTTELAVRMSGAEDGLGSYTDDDSFDERHIEEVMNLELLDLEAVKKRKFRVVVDAINSVGGVILPKLLDRLGVEYKFLNGEATGDFAHNPEPIAANLTGIMDEVAKGGYDLGIVVDPDVDRLAFIQEDGKMYGEEYTLVTVADYILEHVKGNTVSNLSSTRALRDVTEKHGGKYFASAVGEVNVTTKMKEVGAVIGGEGNGGVIYPESHYGRDALVGIALFLSSLAQKGLKASELRKTFPEYFIAKNRIDLTADTDVDAILVRVKELYGQEKDVQVTDIDGVKLDFPDAWVHLRKSNTEPIIRVYSEANTMEAADALGKKLMQVVYDMQ